MIRVGILIYSFSPLPSVFSLLWSTLVDSNFSIVFSFVQASDAGPPEVVNLQLLYSSVPFSLTLSYVLSSVIPWDFRYAYFHYLPPFSLVNIVYDTNSDTFNSYGFTSTNTDWDSIISVFRYSLPVSTWYEGGFFMVSFKKVSRRTMYSVCYSRSSVCSCVSIGVFLSIDERILVNGQRWLFVYS